MRAPKEKSSETVLPNNKPDEESVNRQIHPTAISQVPSLPPQQNQPDRNTDNAPAWEKWAAISIAAGTIGLLVVNIFLMSSTKKAANAATSAAETAENSFQLERRRAEDSDEAICNVRGDLVIGETIEHLSISNSGKVPAHKVRAHIEISRNSLPTNQRLTLFQSLDISEDELRADPIVKDIPLSGFGGADWRSMRELREAIVISGTISYENGFGSNRNKSFCHAELVAPQPPGNNPLELAVLTECDTLPAELSRFLQVLRNRKQ
jgi:hypothetical protein